MSSTADFLHEAYLDIEAGNLRYASALLDSLVSIEPANIEAWEAYMQLCQTCEELDCICERVLQVPGLSSVDTESILDYYYFLRRRMKTCQAETDTLRTITFELVDQFTYSLQDHSTRSSNMVPDNLSLRDLFARLLEKSIVVLYVVLFVTGVKLLANNLQFGYWVLLLLAVNIILIAWSIVFPNSKKNLWHDNTESTGQVL